MDEKNGKQILRAYGLITTIGIQMACCIFLGLYAGRHVDAYCDMAPLFTIIGLLIGIGVAVLGAYRLVMVTMKNGE